MPTPPPLTGPPWTDTDTATLRQLHAAGKSLNAIAGEMSRSKATISKYAAQAGLTFDRTRTAKAAEAVAIDNKARRVRINSRMLDRIEHLQDRLEAPEFKTTLKGEGGRDNQVVLDFVPTPDERNIGDTISRYVVSVAKLEALDSGNGDTSAVGSWLKAMLNR